MPSDWRGSRSGHPAKRRRICPAHRGFQCRNKERRERCPSRSDLRPCPPFGCFCNDLRLKTRRAVGGSTACPLTQELYAVGIGQFEEKVFGLTQFKLASGECGVGIDQVGRTIDGSADFAGIAVLVRCAALGQVPLIKRSARNI